MGYMGNLAFQVFRVGSEQVDTRIPCIAIAIVSCAPTILQHAIGKNLGACTTVGQNILHSISYLEG